MDAASLMLERDQAFGMPTNVVAQPNEAGAQPRRLEKARVRVDLDAAALNLKGAADEVSSILIGRDQKPEANFGGPRTLPAFGDDEIGLLDSAASEGAGPGFAVRHAAPWVDGRAGDVGPLGRSALASEPAPTRRVVPTRVEAGWLDGGLARLRATIDSDVALGTTFDRPSAMISPERLPFAGLDVEPWAASGADDAGRLGAAELDGLLRLTHDIGTFVGAKPALYAPERVGHMPFAAPL